MGRIIVQIFVPAMAQASVRMLSIVRLLLVNVRRVVDGGVGNTLVPRLQSKTVIGTRPYASLMKITASLVVPTMIVYMVNIVMKPGNVLGMIVKAVIFVSRVSLQRSVACSKHVSVLMKTRVPREAALPHVLLMVLAQGTASVVR